MSLATLPSCSYKVGRKEDQDEANQQFCFMSAPVSIKEVKTLYRFFDISVLVVLNPP